MSSSQEITFSNLLEEARKENCDIPSFYNALLNSDELDDIENDNNYVNEFELLNKIIRKIPKNYVEISKNYTNYLIHLYFFIRNQTTFSRKKIKSLVDARKIQDNFDYYHTKDDYEVFQELFLDYALKQNAYRQKNPTNLLEKFNIDDLKSINASKKLLSFLLPFKYIEETYLYFDKDLNEFLYLGKKKDISIYFSKETLSSILNNPFYKYRYISDYKENYLFLVNEDEAKIEKYLKLAKEKMPYVFLVKKKGIILFNLTSKKVHLSFPHQAFN